jgi:hypothetical protein
MVKRILFILTAIASVFSNAFASDCCFFEDNCFFAEGEVGIGYTFRRDNHSFDLNERICGISIDTEREFENIDIHQISTYAKFTTHSNLYFRGMFDYGFVSCGGAFKETRDIDDLLIFHEKGTVDDQYVMDVSAALGFPLVMGCGIENFTFIPLIGYSWHHQKFIASEIQLFLDLEADFDPCFTICGLTEVYEANWYGPWIGFDIELDIFCNWKVFGGFEFHWAEYSSDFDREAFTFLDISFPEFSRDLCGCGYGFLGYGGLNFVLCSCSATFMVSGQQWSAHCGRGIDSDGVISNLECVDWNSLQLTLALNYPF